MNRKLVRFLKSNAIYQLDLTEIYRALHSNTAEYTLFSNVLGTFTKINRTNR